MKNVSLYDAFCKYITVHESNHRLNGDDISPHGSTHHVHGPIFGIFEQKLKTRKHIYNLKILSSAV